MARVDVVEDDRHRTWIGCGESGGHLGVQFGEFGLVLPGPDLKTLHRVLGESVVGRDDRYIDAQRAEYECSEDAGAILAGCAVEDGRQHRLTR